MVHLPFIQIMLAYIYLQIVEGKGGGSDGSFDPVNDGSAAFSLYAHFNFLLDCAKVLGEEWRAISLKHFAWLSTSPS